MSEIIQDHDTEQARSALLYIHVYRRNPRWILDVPSVRLWEKVVKMLWNPSQPRQLVDVITAQPFEVEQISEIVSF